MTYLSSDTMGDDETERAVLSPYSIEGYPLAEAQSDEYWETISETAQASFKSSVESILNTQSDALEMLKISLLVGSLYVPVFGYTTLQELHPILLAIPIFLIIASAVSFIALYFASLGYKVEIDINEIQTDFGEGIERREYLREIAITYDIGARENFKSIDNAGTIMFIGILCQAISVGSFLGLFITS